MSSRLDPDQARQNVGPVLGPICLQRLPAGNEFKQEGNFYVKITNIGSQVVT